MTIERQIEILEQSIKRIESYTQWGICCSLLSSMDEHEYKEFEKNNSLKGTFNKVLIDFDLLKFKPEKTFNDSFWFITPSIKPRVEILNKRIEELKNQL